MSTYIIINVKDLTQEILEASTTENPFELKISNSDVAGQRFVIVRFSNGEVPVSVLASGCTPKSKAALDIELETNTIWNDDEVIDPAVSLEDALTENPTVISGFSQLEFWKMQGFTTLSAIEAEYGFEFVVNSFGEPVIMNNNFVIK